MNVILSMTGHGHNTDITIDMWIGRFISRMMWIDLVPTFIGQVKQTKTLDCSGQKRLISIGGCQYGIP